MENNLIKQENKKATKKIDFLEKKENTINSLFEVEYFLHNLKRIANTIKLYNILK